MILFAVYVCCLCLHLKLLLYLLQNTYFYSTITAAGISWLPRFDSMRGCCRTPRRTWSRILMRVKGGLGVSSGSGHIRSYFLPMLFTSLQASESQFLSNSNYSCFMAPARELQLQYPDIYGITSSVSRVNLFYS